MDTITIPTPPPAEPDKVYWIGTVPAVCDLCHQPLGATFVDGATAPQGRWGILDLRCHRRFGYGIGRGRGQMYRKQADGRWLKVEG
jgi:hypothetical protein